MDSKELDNNKTDYLASGLKSLAGAIPFGGTFVGEIFGTSIPHQRLDRFADFLKQLAEKVETLENDSKCWFDELKKSKENIFLYELGIRYSLDTNSETLHNCFASVIFSCIQNKDLDNLKNERIMKSISELNEAEIIWLIWFAKPKGLFHQSEFEKKYSAILAPRSESSGREEDKIHNALKMQYLTNLTEKGLLYRRNVRIGSPGYITNINDLGLTSYGALIVNALYDQNFYGSISS